MNVAIKGRVELWQWDTNQYLTGLDAASEVHFKAHGNTAITVAVENGDARIPDELLQTASELVAWGYDTDHTLWEFSGEIHPRAKPSAYVYTPYEAMSWGQPDRPGGGAGADSRRSPRRGSSPAADPASAWGGGKRCLLIIHLL